MKTLDYQVLQLLSNNNVTFFIPPYQRNYEWGQEMCEIMFKDIVNVATTNDRNTSQHFFGTIIYYSESTQLGRPNKCILVDGQQRLTTTMLFLIAARDCITDSAMKSHIDSHFLKNNTVGDEIEYKIKLKQVETDWLAYKRIILREPLQSEDLKSSVYLNYKFFWQKLNHRPQNEILDLINNGLQLFNIVTIELEPGKNSWENPQQIFESMNSLGKPLALADLVRNYLLLGKHSDEQNRLYHNYWLRIERNLAGSNNAFSVSAFIRDYMQLIDEASYKKATETNYKELYRDFKELFRNENHESLITTLSDYSREYAILAGYQTSKNKDIDRMIADLRTLKVSAFHSFILGILRLRTDTRITDAECLDILQVIFVYVARKAILGIRKSENKDVPIFSKYLSDLVDAPNKRAKMLEICANQIFAMRLPNDTELRGKLLSEGMNFYNFESGAFLLSLIEEHLTKSRPSLTDRLLQVEHIMPQTLSQQWKDELGQNYEDIHATYLHNIGNLTLIRHNQELSNQSFKDKKEIYDNKSGLQISKNKIVDKTEWNEQTIIARAEYLTEILINKILDIDSIYASGNNYSSEKRSRSNRISFSKLGIIGQKVVYHDDPSISAIVQDDKTLAYEGKMWKLSPLTRYIETTKKMNSSSGSFWGVKKWRYNGKTLLEMIEEVKLDDNEREENEDD
jgi:uncharacterized protein with ParB-like and HNH nuclease domain